LSATLRCFGSLSGAGLGASGLGVFNVEGLYQLQSIREDTEVCSQELLGVGCRKEGGAGSLTWCNVLATRWLYSAFYKL
jgi:hypothetical protein